MEEYNRLVCECAEGTVDACHDVRDATSGELIGFCRLESHLEQDDLWEKVSWCKTEEGKVSPFPDTQDISSRTVQKLQVCVGRPEETG